MICETVNIDEILNTIQTGRMNSRKFNEACDALWKLAEVADEKNRPARAEKKAAEELASKNAKPGEVVKIDCTPEWRGVLNIYIQGIRNRNKKNPPDLIEKMLDCLRRMAAYAQASE